MVGYVMWCRREAAMGLPNTTGHLHSIAARQPESKQTRYKHHKGQKQTNIESLFHHHESFLSSLKIEASFTVRVVKTRVSWICSQEFSSVTRQVSDLI